LSGRIPELVKKLAWGLATALAFGLPTWVYFGATYLPAIGPAYALIGLAAGLTAFVGGTDAADRSTSPMRSYQEDRAKSMIDMLVFAPAAGLTLGLALGQATGMASGLAMGMAIGLAIGLLVTPGGNSAWFAFFCAALHHALHRPSRLPAPWRVMGVLEDANRLGLLRTVGPAYQFRHAALQDHLAPRQNR
jgi:hypothetical protein